MSTIEPTKPTSAAPRIADVRNNFTAAAADIDGLDSRKADKSTIATNDAAFNARLVRLEMLFPPPPPQPPPSTPAFTFDNITLNSVAPGVEASGTVDIVINTGEYMPSLGVLIQADNHDLIGYAVAVPTPHVNANPSAHLWPNRLDGPYRETLPFSFTPTDASGLVRVYVGGFPQQPFTTAENITLDITKDFPLPTIPGISFTAQWATPAPTAASQNADVIIVVDVANGFSPGPMFISTTAGNQWYAQGAGGDSVNLIGPAQHTTTVIVFPFVTNPSETLLARVALQQPPYTNQTEQIAAAPPQV